MTSLSWDELLPGLRARLVGRARRLGVDAEAAEDLAQQALYEAWRLRSRIYDPAGVDRWVFVILGTLCKRRLSNHERLALVADHDEATGSSVDIEAELERRELVELLDRALDELPDETREALVRRFVEQTPIAELARRLGLSEGAVQMRLQRGKLALRKILTTTYQDDAIAHGLIDEADGGWQQTPIWCPGCGSSRWLGRFTGPERRLDLRCAHCQAWHYGVDETVHVTRAYGVTGFRALYRRTAANAYDVWTDVFEHLAEHQHTVSFERGRSPVGTHTRRVDCPQCGFLMSSSLDAQALFSPEGMRFWKDHPRIRRSRYVEIEADGVPAVHTTYESVTSRARFDALLTCDEWRLVRADRS
ncbi:sigma-70 family RNA polymerase sigma factor [Kribbella sp. NPDC049584]|uniref:RNA polymerase sigma factor n=1 Tax=Kribbella sp. NPDC049584 TaxID=3154833 RepID=UPI00342F9ACD